MLEKKYYEVSIINDNWEKIHEEICSQTCNCEHIPDEKIECYDPMYYSPTRSRYRLTEEEAEKLKNHPDVDYVEFDVTFYPELRLIATPCGSFVKREFDSASQQFPKIYRNVDDLGVSVVPSNGALEENKRNNWSVKRTEESTNQYFLDVGFDETKTTTNVPKSSGKANKTLRVVASGPDKEPVLVFNTTPGTSIEVSLPPTLSSEKLTIKRFKTSKESDIPGIINDAIISKYYNSSLNSINYEKSGKNVDVIIADDGLLQYHPEFKDRFPTSGSEPFSGKSRVRDLLLDGPYFLDPEYFDQNTTYKTTKHDGRPTCTRDGALNWWKYALVSNRSARFLNIATFPDIENSIKDYYEDIVIGSPSAPKHETPSSVGTKENQGDHGVGCAGVACGNNFGSAVDARIWNVCVNLGTDYYISFPTVFDLITAFHNAKKLCTDSVVRYSGGDSSNKLNSAPTIVNNSYGGASDDLVGASQFAATRLHNDWVAPKWNQLLPPYTVGVQPPYTQEGPMHNTTHTFSKSVGGIAGKYTVKVSQTYDNSTQKYITELAITDLDSILMAGMLINPRINALHMNQKRSLFAGPTGTPIYGTSGNELINSGVIFVTAAGNENSNIFSYSSPNYDNYLRNFFWYNGAFGEYSLGEPVYRNTRGFPNDFGGLDSASGNAKTINVGAFDHTAIRNVDGSYRESVATFTNRGSGIDIFAPGQQVLSSGRDINRYDSTTYKDRMFNGTSCACPATVGVISLYLEEKPDATYNDVQNWLKTKGSVKADFYNEYSDPNDPKYWESRYALLDSPDRMLHNPYVNKVYSFIAKDSTLIDAANNTPESVFLNVGLTQAQALSDITSPPTYSEHS